MSSEHGSASEATPEVQHPEHLIDQIIRISIQELGLRVPETGMEFDDGFTYTAYVDLGDGRRIKVAVAWDLGQEEDDDV